MKLLRLATTLNPTSAPYNQFSLGFKAIIDQTYCSLLKNDVPIDNSISGFHADGSIFKMIKLVRKLVAQNSPYSQWSYRYYFFDCNIST